MSFLVSESLSPGRSVGRYTVRGPLTEGRTAVVVRAEERLGLGGTRDVALLCRPVSQTERTAAEARLAASFAHPLLCPVLDVGAADGFVYQVRPLLAGLSGAALQRRLAAAPTARSMVAARLVADLADLVAAAADAGWAHGDLRLAKVLLGFDGAPRLLPFAGETADGPARQRDLERLAAIHSALGGAAGDWPGGHAARVADALRRSVVANAPALLGPAGLRPFVAPSQDDSPKDAPPGRAALVDELAAELTDGGLLTLVGAAGIGKTAIVETLVARREGQLLAIEGDAVGELAQELGVAPDGPRAARIERVGRALASRGAILIALDGVDGGGRPLAEAVTRWRTLAPETAVVFTSRAPIEGLADSAREVPPLAPDDARGVLLAGQTTDDPAVDEVLDRLGGNPLALRIASRRLRMLGAEALLERLRAEEGDHGGDDAVRTTIEGVWGRLSDAEEATLVQLAVFAGAFDAEVAEAVVGAPVEDDVAELLAKLVDRALLRHRSHDEGLQLEMPESVRELAVRHADPAMLDGARARHRAWYVSWAGRRPGGALVEGRAELLAAASAPGPVDARAEALLALSDRLEGSFADDLDPVAERLLAAPQLGDDRRAGLLALRGRLALRRGDVDDAETYLDDAHGRARANVGLRRWIELDRAELAQTTGRFEDAATHLSGDPPDDPELAGRWDRAQGLLAHAQGRLDDAWASYARALTRAGERNDARREAELRQLMGTLRLQQGRLHEARSHFDVALTLERELGDRRVEGLVLGNLGILAQEEGDRDAARRLYEGAIAALRAVGEELFVAHTLGYLAGLLQEEGELDEAQERYGEALAILRSVGDARLLGVFEAARGGLEAERGHLDDADDAFARADEQLAAVGDPALLAALAVHRGHADLARYDRRPEVDDEALRAFRDAEARLVAGESAGRSDDLRFATRLLRSAVELRALVVADDGQWFSPPGDRERHSLGRRVAPRRILVAFAKARVDGGEPLDADAVFAAGWPDEQVLPQAGQNRVHVALSTLRRLGLKELLVRRGDGWVLGPGAPCRWA